MWRSDSIAVWRNEEVRRRLSHYYKVMKGERNAKYRVVKRFPVDFSDDMTVEELMSLHSEMRREFDEFYEEKMERDLTDNIPHGNFLELKIRIVKLLVRECKLCEWRCGARRLEGERGVCGLDSKVRVSTAFLHMGEEAPLVPSGTIFFTGCSFKCVFCQNYDISTNPFNGIETDPQRLASICRELSREGARNINYVGGNPDQQLHVIIPSLRYMDVNIPLLWNSNMYMTEEALELLLDLIDIWLPDFKYGNNECGLRLSKVKNYFEIVSRNHKRVCEVSDVIIRHLVLPNHIECCTKPVLLWIARHCNRALVNVMSQYRPEHLVYREPEKYSDIARRPNNREMEEAYKYADELGLCWKPVS